MMFCTSLIFPGQWYSQNRPIASCETVIDLPSLAAWYLQKIMNELGYIDYSHSQGRNKQAQNVETIIEIAPEQALVDLGLQPPVCGCNDSDIDGENLVGPKGPYLHLLDHPRNRVD